MSKLISICFFLLSFTVHGAPCSKISVDDVDEYVQIAYVYDGDTVKLSDGRKIRLIGINAPEIYHDGRAAQPFAHQSRKALQLLLDSRARNSQSRIGLRYGQEKFDRYKRVLAHLYINESNNGAEEPLFRNVQAMLVKQGMAMAITFPPNLLHMACYQSVEKAANKRRLGLWSNNFYAAIDAANLDQNAKGFHRIKGAVTSVSQSKDSWWINLLGSVALRIYKKDFVYFDKAEIFALNHQYITVRGWLYKVKNQLRMRLRHPSSVRVTNK